MRTPLYTPIFEAYYPAIYAPIPQLLHDWPRWVAPSVPPPPPAQLWDRESPVWWVRGVTLASCLRPLSESMLNPLGVKEENRPEGSGDFFPVAFSKPDV